MKLKPVKARKVIKILEKLGYRLLRVTGSHYIYKKEGKGLIPVPRHGDEELCPGLLSKIIREIGIDREAFFKASQRVVVF